MRQNVSFPEPALFFKENLTHSLITNVADVSEVLCGLFSECHMNVVIVKSIDGGISLWMTAFNW